MDFSKLMEQAQKMQQDLTVMEEELFGNHLYRQVRQ